MTHRIENLIRDISQISEENLLAAWLWKLEGRMKILMISNMGDLFLENINGKAFWLRSDGGELEKVAESREEFKQLLHNEETIDNWLLPEFVDKLMAAGITLKDNEVYSPKQLPVLGGDYDISNFQGVDMNVHFEFTGVISKRIKDLPDGTSVIIKVI